MIRLKHDFTISNDTIGYVLKRTVKTKDPAIPGAAKKNDTKEIVVGYFIDLETAFVYYFKQLIRDDVNVQDLDESSILNTILTSKNEVIKEVRRFIKEIKNGTEILSIKE